MKFTMPHVGLVAKLEFSIRSYMANWPGLPGIWPGSYEHAFVIYIYFYWLSDIVPSIMYFNLSLSFHHTH
jgi:hypothetical protein